METAYGLTGAEARDLLERLAKIVPPVVAARGGHEDADEIEAEVVLRVQRALVAGRAEMRAHLEDDAFLGGLARNVCRECERRKGVERQRRSGMAATALQSRSLTTPQSSAEAVSLHEDASALQAALARLPDGQRAVATLRAAGHDPAEIARILGRSRWSVRAALDALRRQLTPRHRVAQIELPRPSEPPAPFGFFAGRRTGWERPWTLHLAGATSTNIARTRRVPQAAAKKRIQRIRRAILAARGPCRSGQGAGRPHAPRIS